MAFEIVLAAGHFLRLYLLHDFRRHLLRDELRARCLECRVSKSVITVEMAIDHEADRFAGHFADFRDQFLPRARMLTGVDHHHTVIGDEEDGIGARIIKEEIKVVGDLLHRDGRRVGLGDCR